ncbi:hypothetical protein INT48_005041 [Thamnidium elegans]|uniref:Uncharacterized protein n=1 Tax=Thamnidium elegans TaxID=101142 RepID=A0A8H7SP21_9FUNG|nr:hypothetical protein INT48_005041 [Thamnidium elegans]
MFSKSKRFPEGSHSNKFMKLPSFLTFPPPVYFSAGKDYVPGPGEYDLSAEDKNRNKRIGFITQTNRFPDGTVVDPSLSNEGSTTSMSSDTRVSCTSSNDDSTPSPTRKKIPNILDTSNIQFEKYRNTMQKEMEALQIKSKKLESTIQSLELEKNDAKSMLITKDLELADLRSKNATLHKTLNRPSKDIQLQKKIDQLKENISDLKIEHENEIQVKNQMIEQLGTESNRSAGIIANFEKEHEALEAQISTLSVRLSESKNSVTKNEIHIDHLQQELNSIKNTNITLMQDLETSRNETQDLKTVNNELMITSQMEKDTIKQLESRVLIKEEEVDALLETIQDKNSTIDKLQLKFKQYRHWVDNTIVPYLTSQRKSVQDYHYKELNQLLTELHEAKKFINTQAQHLNGLKSDVHWLSVQNSQLNEIILNMNDDISYSVSSSSRSSLSYRDEADINTPLDSNIIVLNDSGFGLLVDEEK